MKKWKAVKIIPKKKLLSKDIGTVPTRNGYGQGLVEAGKRDKNVMVLCSDLTESTRSEYFKDVFPERFVQLGITEQAMASLAAGMALTGKVPFISSYACFSPGRNWEQIRTAGALQYSNVKIGGAHAGISVGPDGATHQMLEDIALMRVLPRMTVIVPCDVNETQKATVAAAKTEGPMYIRFARSATPVFTVKTTPFKIGRAEVYRTGDDITIIACGPMVYQALIAAEELEKKYKISAMVINNHTIKPLDEKTIIAAAKHTGAVVTAEEAQAAAGMGSAVGEVLALKHPVPMERVGIQDRSGESGDPDLLFEACGLTAPFIVLAAIRVVKRKEGKPVANEPEHITAAREKAEQLKAKSLKKKTKRKK